MPGAIFIVGFLPPASQPVVESAIYGARKPRQADLSVAAIDH